MEDNLFLLILKKLKKTKQKNKKKKKNKTKQKTENRKHTYPQVVASCSVILPPEPLDDEFHLVVFSNDPFLKQVNPKAKHAQKTTRKNPEKWSKETRKKA